MAQPASPHRVHLVAGGFPRGTAAGHDIDYARLRILQALHEEAGAEASVARTSEISRTGYLGLVV